MPQANDTPKITRLMDLPVGGSGEFFALLVERTPRETREGKPFFVLTLRDARRTVNTVVWADSEWFAACADEWQPGDFFRIRATYGEHRTYGPQLDRIELFRPICAADRAAGFRESDFLEVSRFDTAELLAELHSIAEQAISNEPLRRLVRCILDTHAEALKKIPAHPQRFYVYPGGWLEHTRNVARSCQWLIERYRGMYDMLTPPLNADLVIAGALLHDIGRAVELNPESPTQQTIPGALFGHQILGRDVVRDAAVAQGDVDPELLCLLEHLIVSHLTLPEWGSQRQPLIPEVLILHHADDLDAKLEMYIRGLMRDTGPGPFTAPIPRVGRALLKERKA